MPELLHWLLLARDGVPEGVAVVALAVRGSGAALGTERNDCDRVGSAYPRNGAAGGGGAPNDRGGWSSRADCAGACPYEKLCDDRTGAVVFPIGVVGTVFPGTARSMLPKRLS